MLLSTTVVSTRILPLDYVALSCQGHNPIMQLPDRLRSNGLSQTDQCFGVRHFLHPDPAEAAIDNVGPHFPFQCFVTPVAHMLQHQHAQGYFRWRLLTPAKTALRMPLSLCVVNCI